MIKPKSLCSPLASRAWWDAAIMGAAHNKYYDAASGLCTSVFASSMKSDASMRSFTQYRRTPWGIRVLERDSDILKLKAGTVVPQLVLCEKLRFSRAAKGSSQFLVPPDVSGDLSLNSRTAQGIDSARHIGAGPQLRAELQHVCAADWKREYPKPVRMWRDRGEWIINFQNHAADKNPSTVCRGNHNTLLIQGTGAPDGPFVLPGELTANELGDHLALRFGLMSPAAKATPNNSSDSRLSHFEKLKQGSGRSFKRVAGSARITYLTTETFTTEAIAAVYEKAAEPLLKLELDQLPPLYPIAVPTAKDKRARAQDIKEIVREILTNNEKADRIEVPKAIDRIFFTEAVSP